MSSSLEMQFENIPYHENIIIEKTTMPTLPPCFKPTLLGSYRLGMKGQYRCRNLHAYDFDTYWSIHKDIINPEEHPLQHLVEDAPIKFMAGLVFLGFLSWYGWDKLKKMPSI